MSDKEICSFLERFGDHGGENVLLTGGEALLRRDLCSIILYAKSLGLKIGLFTNATLMSQQFADFAADNIDSITVSLDGPQHIHNWLRGDDESFQRAIRGLEMLRNANVHLNIQSMIVPQNICDTDWLIQLAQRFKPSTIKLSHVSRIGRGKQRKDLWLNQNQMDHIKGLAGVISKKCDNFRTCVLTNIITAQELRAFYPDFECSDFNNELLPWMLPDGTVLTCYVDRFQSYWKLSTDKDYPIPMRGALERREKLLSVVKERTRNLDSFDFMELISSLAEEIARKDTGANEASK
jgi:MoaA/NifB/PqqE/SkfB family radical SAM enzyme